MFTVPTACVNRGSITLRLAASSPWQKSAGSRGDPLSGELEMDQNEIAQRLKDLRERIRAELAEGAPPRLADGLVETSRPELPDFEAPPAPTEPQVYTTTHLQAANDLVVTPPPVPGRPPPGGASSARAKY